MDLKIRLSENLDSRLRAHAENTGSTLNSIICLAIDAFVPGGSGTEWAQKAGWTQADWAAFEAVKAAKSAVKTPVSELVEVKKRVVVASKQPISPKPKLSLKPTKAERRNLSEWHRLHGQGDLLDKA